MSYDYFKLTNIDKNGLISAECLECNQEFIPRANGSIRAIARHFLSQSLPFADCPEISCSNHGANIYEDYRKYGQARVAHRVRCKGKRYAQDADRKQPCGKTFALGEPFALSRTNKGGK